MMFRGSKRFKILVGAVTVLLLIGAGLLALPEILRRVAVAQLDKILAAPVSIQDIDLNLFTGRGSVSNFVIQSPKDPRPLVQLPRLDFDFWPLGLLRGRLTIHSLLLSQPELFIVRIEPTRFNITEVIELPDKERHGAPALEFTIEQFAVQGGTVAFLDRTVSPQFERTLKNVTLTAGRISSTPKLVVTPTSFDLRLNLDDGSVAMSGEATPIARPVGVEVTARWKNLNPAIFQAYLPAGPVLDLSGTRSSGEAKYVLLHEQKKAHQITATFTTGPIKLYAPDGEQPVLSVAGSDIRNMHWDVLRNEGRLEGAFLQHPHLRLKRSPQGVFTLTRLFDGEAARAEGEPGEREAPLAVPFVIDRLGVERGTIEFLDHNVKPNVKALFEDIQLTAKNFSMAADAEPAQVTVEARLGKSPVRIEGALKPYPFASRLQISAKNLPLESYEGYLQPLWTPVDEWGGSLDGNVELKLGSHQDDLEVELSGQLAATKLMLGFSDSREPPFQAQRVNVQLAQLRTHPEFFLDINRLQISGAELEIGRDAEGNLNLSRLWAGGDDDGNSSAGADQASSAGKTADAEPSFVIGRSIITDSSIQFVDATVKPAFKTTLTDVSLEIGKLGRQTGFSSVNFQATLEETAKLELEGSIKPFETPVQIKLDGLIRDYDLAELNPYATKFIRYEIERGRVTTDVEYSYDAGDLTGQNQIAIHHLQLGDRLGDEFEEQIGVSLRLAIALLQDADGVLRLSVPVSGDLTDPQFDFGRLVWRAVRNAVISFLSAPLRLLGNIVTLGGRITEIRIEPVEFQPGSADLKPSGEKQVTELAQLMQNKPRLELELRGVASPEELDELKRKRLRRQIKESGEPYDEAIRRLYRLATDGGGKQLAKRASVEEMEAYLAQKVVLPQDALKQLAAERAAYLEEKLTEAGVEKGRLYVESQLGDRLPGRVEFDLLG